VCRPRLKIRGRLCFLWRLPVNEWQQHCAHNSEHGIQAFIWVSRWQCDELFLYPFFCTWTTRDGRNGYDYGHTPKWIYHKTMFSYSSFHCDLLSLIQSNKAIRGVHSYTALRCEPLHDLCWITEDACHLNQIVLYLSITIVVGPSVTAINGGFVHYQDA
jgi:hypothetical protein